MAAAPWNIVIEQGADFSFACTYFPEGQEGDPFDWTGWTGAAQVRKRVTSTDVLLDLGVEANSSGRVLLSASSGQTDDVPAGDAVYDLELTDGTYVIRLLSGRAVVKAGVTR